MSDATPKKVTDPWGRVILTSDDLFDLFYNEVDTSLLSVKPDERIDRYNEMCDSNAKKGHMIAPLTIPDLSPKEEHARRAKEWFISEEHRHVKVRESLLDRCFTDEERERVNMEMDMFEERDLIPLLQLMFGLVDHFRNEGIVWGVGRGSSCASYCLFLIGVHKIDSLRFGLDISEFLKPL